MRGRTPLATIGIEDVKQKLSIMNDISAESIYLLEMNGNTSDACSEVKTPLAPLRGRGRVGIGVGLG